VISENRRVLDAVEALNSGNLSHLGSLMYESHMSLKNDYDVSSAELDTIVDICAESKGVYGARMTGAGFGGSAVCLVENEHVESLVEWLQKEYPEKTGMTPAVFVCTVEGGVVVTKYREVLQETRS
jgi:galactokinase